MTTEEFGKELARIQRDSFVEKQIALYADFLPRRFKEILEESSKMEWRDQNAYEAGCFRTLLEILPKLNHIAKCYGLKLSLMSDFKIARTIWARSLS